MLKINKLYLYSWLVAILLSGGFLHAQQHLSEPYSRFGLGELQSRSSASVKGMGTTGYAFGEATTINTLNPASYSYFDSLSSVIDASFSFRSHTLRESGRVQNGSTAYMEYLYLGLPVTSRWSTAIGVQPFSVVNYNYSKSDLLCERHDEGVGGTYELFWGNALEITPALSVGLQTSYLFGTSTRLHELVFSDHSYLSTRSEDEYSIRGLQFKAGIQAEIPVGKYSLGLGVTFTPSIPNLMKVEHSLIRYSYQSGSSDVSDTLAWESSEKSVVKENLTNPMCIGGGISLSRREHFWTGLDFTWSQWSRFSFGEPLADSYRISWGGRLIPSVNSSKYWKKMTLIGGCFYEKDYVLIQEKALYRSGIDLGVSFPMKKSKTKLSVYAEVGNYQLPDRNSGISEQYVSFTFQLQLHEKWYQRRKLD